MPLDLWKPAAKDGLISATGNFEDQSLVRALRSKVCFDALSQLGRIDPDDIVLACVISRGSAKNPGAYFLFVDLRAAVFERMFSDVEQKITQPCSADKMLTGGHSLDQSAPFFNAWLIRGL